MHQRSSVGDTVIAADSPNSRALKNNDNDSFSIKKMVSPKKMARRATVKYSIRQLNSKLLLGESQGGGMSMEEFNRLKADLEQQMSTKLQTELKNKEEE